MSATARSGATTEGEATLAEEALDDHRIVARWPFVQRADLPPMLVRQSPCRRADVLAGPGPDRLSQVPYSPRRRTVLSATPTSRAIDFLPTPRPAGVRITVTNSSSITVPLR
jgi:hypothetical protein